MPEGIMKEITSGIHPMLYAFFDEHGRLDRNAMRRQVEAVAASGAHGVAMLGLGTEVGKLSPEERSTMLSWVQQDLGGRLPLTVTIAEQTVEAAKAAVLAAERAGAACVVLQPPAKKGLPEEEYIAFFGAIADAASVPVGVQNAPDYIGIGLSLEGIASMADRHPNIRMLKAEGSALYASSVVEATQGRLKVFNGRCGLELTDNLRGGCAGMIPAIESMDIQSRIFELMMKNDPACEIEAERLYAQILPMTVFVIQSLDSFLCYGKRIAAKRLGLGPVHDRQPALKPTAAGLSWADRFAASLPPLN